jgi:hypothetical protein
MALTSRADIMNNLAAGKGYYSLNQTATTGAGTNANSTSGFISLKINFNTIGTTAPDTLVGIPTPDSTTQSLMVQSNVGFNTSRSGWIGRLYVMGTQVLTATGDQFTHASTFTSLQRTIFGAASQAIEMFPLIYITTATTTTAAVLRLNTAAAGAGYTNQAGSNIVGTVDTTLPAAATAVDSMYLLSLTGNDSAIQDIIAIETRTAAATGAATIFGFEPIAPFISLASIATPSVFDCIFAGTQMSDLEPATPNSGTVTSYLVAVSMSTSGVAYVINNIAVTN